MKDAATVDEIERLRLEDRPKEVHLIEKGPIQSVGIAKFPGQLQRIGTEVHTEHGPLRHGEIEGQLPRAAADLQHPRAKWDRPVQCARKNALLGAMDQTAH